MELARHGWHTPMFRSSVVLCVAWAFASALCNRNHWHEAAKPPKLYTDGVPARRKLWWALWPFFNLAFMTALAAVVHEHKTHDDFVSVVADDRLWNVAALGAVLALVSYSVLRGATVTLCSREPNVEFTAGFLSAALFSWFSPIIDVGQTKQLDLDDLPLQACSSSYCGWRCRVMFIFMIRDTRWIELTPNAVVAQVPSIVTRANPLKAISCVKHGARVSPRACLLEHRG